MSRLTTSCPTPNTPPRSAQPSTTHRLELAHMARQSLDALPNLLTIPQATEALSLAKSTIYDQIIRNEFPHVKIGEWVYVSNVQIAQILGVELGPKAAANGTSDKAAMAAALKLMRSMTVALDRSTGRSFCTGTAPGSGIARSMALQ